MSLKFKWHARQVARAILTAPLSLSFALAVLCIFRSMQFHRYGLAMYPQFTFPKAHNVAYELEAFWAYSL